MNERETSLADFKDEQAGTHVRVLGDVTLIGEPDPKRTEVEVGGKFIPLADLVAAYEGELAAAVAQAGEADG